MTNTHMKRSEQTERLKRGRWRERKRWERDEDLRVRWRERWEIDLREKDGEREIGGDGGRCGNREMGKRER